MSTREAYRKSVRQLLLTFEQESIMGHTRTVQKRIQKMRKLLRYYENMSFEAELMEGYTGTLESHIQELNEIIRTVNEEEAAKKH